MQYGQEKTSSEEELPEKKVKPRFGLKRMLLAAGLLAAGAAIFIIPNRRIAIAAFFAVLGLAGLIFADSGIQRKG